MRATIMPTPSSLMNVMPDAENEPTTMISSPARLVITPPVRWRPAASEAVLSPVWSYTSRIRDSSDIASACALQFAAVYFTLFLKLWHAHPFPVLAPSEIDPGLREQLERYIASIGADIPVGTMLIFLRCWMLLYGAVAMEMFGHLGFALDDPSPMFDIMLGDLAALVGLRYPLPDES